jgi:cell shape-determining protein MreC
MEILVSGLSLKQGTKVLTSMHSEKVPGGIRIGTILRQETVLEYGTIDLYVKPSVEIGSVREVWVLQ